MNAPARPLVLASTSSYRQALLARLGIPFEVQPSGVDETARPGEGAEALVARLSEEKARAVAATRADALVIGSDQLAVADGEVLGKPGGFERAVAQLARVAGRSVVFLTGLCVVDAASGRAQRDVVAYRVVFRALDRGAIERYVRREAPYDCAGSFKMEGLGVALFERLEGDDPNALVGLPLIRLVRMLEAEGVAVL